MTMAMALLGVRELAGTLRLQRREAAGLPELAVPSQIKLPGLHQALLLHQETALEEALERRLPLGPEEEGVAGHEVGGRHEEADGLHDVPGELPECEPHEAGRLEGQGGQPSPQLPPYLEGRCAVNVYLHGLHGLQLFSCRVVLRDRQRSGYGYGLLDCFHNLQFLRKETKNVPKFTCCSSL